MNEEISLSVLQLQQQEAQQQLDEIERKIKSQQALSATNDVAGTDPYVKLQDLSQKAAQLALAQELVEWTKEYDVTESASLMDKAKACHALQQILHRHRPQLSSQDNEQNLWNQMHEQEYLPRHKYTVASLVQQLRVLLQQAEYPTTKDIRSKRLVADIRQTCHSLQLLDEHRLVRELMRPVVQRVQFHFLERDPERETTHRTERLVEWLLTYLKDTVLQQLQILRPPVALWNELVRLVQYVVEERAFFEDPKIVGERSRPLWLCNAIEQFLQFDDNLRHLAASSSSDMAPAVTKTKLISLMDVFVTGNNDLLQWWLQREQESALASLSEEVPSIPNLFVSPKAELFGAVLRSALAKASVFSFSGPYLQHIAVPLCTTFIDAIQESVHELRETLAQRRVFTDQALHEHICEWIQLVNGAHMSYSILVSQEDSLSEADLRPYGEALQKLERVLIDEFASNFVEILLMERAKLVRYMMRCPHLLSCETESDDVAAIPNDLEETRRIVTIAHDALNTALIRPHHRAASETEAMVSHGAQALRVRLFSALAIKFLDMAIDSAGVVTDLYRHGCQLFALDINTLFHFTDLPPVALRLLDIVSVMEMEGAHLAGLGNALCDLVSQPPPLEIEAFAYDEKVYEEAMSMLEAKGLHFLELQDFLTVLNRRRDL